MTIRRLTTVLSLAVLVSVGIGCGFKQTGEIEEAQDAGGAGGKGEAEESGAKAGSGEKGGAGGESDEAGGTGAGGTGGAGPGGSGGSTDGNAGTGASSSTLLVCNPTEPPVTSCSGVTCAPLGETALSTCEEICCTADGRCGTANTSQELARACTASLVQHPDCPAADLLGQQVTGCCRSDGRCGVDATQIKAMAEAFGFPVDECFAREDIPDLPPYLAPLDPIACTP